MGEFRGCFTKTGGKYIFWVGSTVHSSLHYINLRKNRYILLPTVFVDSLLASRGSIASPETTSQARQSKSKSRAVSDCGIGLDGRLWHTYLYKTIRPPIVGKL